eukprot:TCALIF_06020-PA protein Name:"Protein of unknown function" AED:0.17 eAED:0.17 QI:30/1/0.5/1/1/1/2/153/72
MRMAARPLESSTIRPASSALCADKRSRANSLRKTANRIALRTFKILVQLLVQIIQSPLPLTPFPNATNVKQP